VGDPSDLPLGEVVMVDGQTVFGAVVTKVDGSWGQEVIELALGAAAPKLVKLHVHRLCPVGNDGLVSDANSCEAVTLEGGPRLWPSHVNQQLSKGYLPYLWRKCRFLQAQPLPLPQTT
jgi:hypothetical protein